MTTKKKAEKSLLDEIELLGTIQATEVEVAGHLDMTHDELKVLFDEKPELRLKFEASQSKGRVKLRHRQWKEAIDGNKTMLVWLGKNYLGQSEKSQEDITQTSFVVEVPPETTEDSWNDLASKEKEIKDRMKKEQEEIAEEEMDKE